MLGFGTLGKICFLSYKHFLSLIILKDRDTNKYILSLLISFFSASIEALKNL